MKLSHNFSLPNFCYNYCCNYLANPPNLCWLLTFYKSEATPPKKPDEEIEVLSFPSNQIVASPRPKQWVSVKEGLQGRTEASKNDMSTAILQVQGTDNHDKFRDRPVYVASASFWNMLACGTKWMNRALALSFGCLMHHVAGHPEALPMVAATGMGDEGHDTIQSCRNNATITKSILMNAQVIRRNQMRQRSSIAYVTAFQSRHYATVIAFVPIKSILVMDGYFPAPAYWQHWIYTLLWCITEESTPFESFTLTYMDEKKTCTELLEATQSYNSSTGSINQLRSETPWTCYTASDAISQTDNSTECGFLHCMNLWRSLYKNKGKLPTPPENASLHTSRHAIIQLYKCMIEMLDQAGELKMSHPRKALGDLPSVGNL